ncbi:uncharacterized protein GGS22DRAFT_37690 [Annulohypoxylon maeteangense]|uniref:uncharacterized protein n=1 Tax=Annulohypoxylon maeteangense TaxID=1927788 RepID=UPI002008698E|nr:uncharacterized protein GGS22DRAFT_37690 [Annulohypoxylon maeteangense]KAI0883235.1 hypothetical protein GGS22DRAFT_37690 [Annulohypoxylon maeteangense]
MFNILTFYFTDDPDWQARDCEMQMPDGEMRVVRTWAPYLVGDPVYDEFKNYDIEMRTLIARCMADDPDDRPPLDELVDAIEYFIGQGDEAANEESRRLEEMRAQNQEPRPPPIDVKRAPDVESDELLKRWAREYINEPLMRQDPYADLWDS